MKPNGKARIIRLKPGCQFALAVASSVNLRETPLFRQPNIGPGLRIVQVTSAETNVASVSSYLDLPVAVMTALIKGNPDSHTVRRDLRSRGMTVFEKWFEPTGPWGHRHATNEADSGFGTRGAVVSNARAGEVGAMLEPEHFDLEEIFGRRGPFRRPLSLSRRVQSRDCATTVTERRKGRLV